MASDKGKPARRKRNTASSSLHPSDQWISIETGNYKGQWNHRTMSGEGIYAKLDGTVYKGQFENGLYHGAGTMYFPSGCRIEGIWEYGKCVERWYITNDGLKLQPDNWQYCVASDRRFVMEHINGIEPAATNRITDGPLIKIPTGTYDTGEGFYQPFTNTVHDYWTNALLKVPTAESAKWIMENCRREGDDKKVSDCQTELDENEYKMRANACLDIDNEQNTVHNDQSIIAEIKSYPSSVFDLSLTDLQPHTELIFISSSSSSLSSSSSSSSSTSPSANCPKHCNCKKTMVDRSRRRSFSNERSKSPSFVQPEFAEDCEPR